MTRDHKFFDFLPSYMDSFYYVLFTLILYRPPRPTTSRCCVRQYNIECIVTCEYYIVRSVYKRNPPFLSYTTILKVSIIVLSVIISPSSPRPLNCVCNWPSCDRRSSCCQEYSASVQWPLFPWKLKLPARGKKEKMAFKWVHWSINHSMRTW